MRDFKRIGGEILSSPLNENFRKLRDDISIANVNLVFSDDYGIVATIQDMRDLLTNPAVNVVDGQVCYVVSSGELYRFSTLDNDWHKIADFGQTFNQVFLNSGIVLMEDYIRVKSDNETLVIPKSLVYFKNRPGEDPYLKGVYLLEETNLNAHEALSSNNTVFSIMVDFNKQYTIVPGVPKTDDPSIVFLGSFLAQNHFIQSDFIYTMPDMAYTADRGTFLLNGGQCSGAELYATANALDRYSGYYYDEGVNYPGHNYYVCEINNLSAGRHYFKIDNTYYSFNLSSAITIASDLRFYIDKPNELLVYQNGLKAATYVVSTTAITPQNYLTFNLYDTVEHYPDSLESTSNYNMLELDGLTDITYTYYTNNATPVDNLVRTDSILIPSTTDLKYPHGIVYDKYYSEGQEQDVTPGEFTIQKHLITPSGQNIMILGTEEYVDLADAEAHLNDNISIGQYFLYAEVTRVIVQNPLAGDDFNPETHCTFYSLNRLSLAGNINPVFDDEEFKLFDGSEETPWFLQFKLDEFDLETTTSDTYHLLPMKYSNNPDPSFGLTQKYLAKNDIVNTNNAYNRVYNNTINNSTANKGYIIPSMQNIETLRQRTTTLEKEIWDIYHAFKEDGTTPRKRYEQSLNWRLYQIENDMYNEYNDEVNSENIISKLNTAVTNLTTAVNQKANKISKINNYPLGDTSYDYDDTEHPYTITLYTGDIDEGVGRGSTRNEWFTVAKVKNVDWVADAHTHLSNYNNPHRTTTDNIIVNSGSNNVFMTPIEKTKLGSIPADTATQLQTLNNNKIEHLNLIEIDDANSGAESQSYPVKTLKVHSHGVNITIPSGSETAILECVGQVDSDTLLYRSEYTPIADATTGKSGYVDKALVADNLDTTDIDGSQYYGSDENLEIGWHDLPVYVSTTDTSPSSSVNIDSVLLQPEAQSVALKHLATSRTTYGAGDEETVLNDNVYNLVKNHYHQVYNSGTQGPYIEDPNHPGTYIQDTSSIVYTYKVPYGGMAEHIYYFEYGNDNYTFNTTNLGIIPVNTVLTYIPSSGNIEVTISGTTSTLTTNSVSPSVVDEDYFIEFVAQTDWSKINKWNFGNNLTVTVVDGIATINAFNASGDTPVHSFVNLDDVNVTYQSASPGQMLVINDNCNGIVLSNAPSMSNYMLISDYVNPSQPTKVKAAIAADSSTTAASANTAALLQGSYSVDNNSSGSTSLWTATKISQFVSNAISTQGVRTDYGNTVPTSHTFAFTPKVGDLYILTE